MEVRYPPPQKGYLSDACAIPFENKANGCDTPLGDTISKGYCAIWGLSHSGPLRSCDSRFAILCRKVQGPCPLQIASRCEAIKSFGLRASGSRSIPFSDPKSSDHLSAEGLYNVQQMDAAVLGGRLPEVTQKPFLGPASLSLQ